MTQEARAMEGVPTAQPSSLGSGEGVHLPAVCFQSPRGWTQIITGPGNGLHPGDELGKKAKPRSGSGWG